MVSVLGSHPTGHSRNAPIDSAASIHPVAEIINRIWGFRPPGGRSFLAPAAPQIVLPCWLSTVVVEPKEIDYLDRHFVVHVGRDPTELPRNVNQFAGLPKGVRGGRWLLLKSDFPGDAAVHSRANGDRRTRHLRHMQGLLHRCGR